MRVFLQYILPFIAPTLVYLAWAWWKRRHQDEEAPVEKGPWFLLILAGFALAATSVIVFGLSKGHDPHSTYTPPSYKDGKVIPGGMQ